MFEKDGLFEGIKGKWENFSKSLKRMKDKKRRTFAKAKVPHLNNKNRESTVIDIPPAVVARSTVIVLLVLLAFFFLYNLWSILLILFVSFLFAAALDPLVDRLEEYRVPRALSVLGIFVLVFALGGIFVSNVAELIVEQVHGIASTVGAFVDGTGVIFGGNYGETIDQLFATVDVQQAANQLQQWFGVLYEQLLSFSFGLVNLLIVLVLTFFMAVEEESIENFFRSLFPSRYADYITTRMEAVKDQIGLWLRGQLLVSIIAAAVSYVGLAVMGIEYALTLSLIAGISMVIPVVGRFFAWIVTFPIVFNQAPSLALAMSIYYLVVQQFENNLIVPYIMNKAVGLNPIVIIIAMMVGGHYLGLIGLVLAVPVATTLSIFVKDYANSKSK